MPLQGDQLSRMTIRGFKSIKSCDISFGKINVLIGSNGAGKSNFISAFSFLQNILSKNLQVSVGQSGLSSLLYKGRKVTEEIDFEVFFGQNSYGFVLVPTDDNRLIFQKEYFGYHGDLDNESNIGCGYSESQWENGVHSGIDDSLSKPCASRIGGCIISMTQVRVPESSRSITFPIIKCCCTMRQTLPHSFTG